jgi:murein DD-endopeptidase MepM/ murein hydrolase activator NlpD
MTKPKCCKPYKTCTPNDLAQGFIQDHLANDYASKYGTFLVAPFNGKVDVVTGAEMFTTDGKPSWELKRGNGIRIKSTENPEISVMYWHCLPFFPVKVGDIVLQGQPVAQMGNSGYVRSGGEVVPYELRNTPNYPGTHVHLTIGTKDEYWDFSQMISWDIPVNYDLMTAIKNVLQNISNFLKGR